MKHCYFRRNPRKHCFVHFVLKVWRVVQSISRATCVISLFNETNASHKNLAPSHKLLRVTHYRGSKLIHNIWKVVFYQNGWSTTFQACSSLSLMTKIVLTNLVKRTMNVIADFVGSTHSMITYFKGILVCKQQKLFGWNQVQRLR